MLRLEAQAAQLEICQTVAVGSFVRTLSERPRRARNPRNKSAARRSRCTPAGVEGAWVWAARGQVPAPRPRATGCTGRIGSPSPVCAHHDVSCVCARASLSCTVCAHDDQPQTERRRSCPKSRDFTKIVGGTCTGGRCAIYPHRSSTECSHRELPGIERRPDWPFAHDHVCCRIYSSQA